MAGRAAVEDRRAAVIRMNPGLTVPDDDALILAADGADEHRNLPAAVFAVDRLAAVARKFALGHADDAGAAVACAARHADQRDARLAGERSEEHTSELQSLMRI